MCLFSDQTAPSFFYVTFKPDSVLCFFFLLVRFHLILHPENAIYGYGHVVATCNKMIKLAKVAI
jgi:hypothetical protein